MSSMAGETAIVGIGQTPYYKRGAAPEAEFTLALRAILAAAEDAGLPVEEIDGFTSFYQDRNSASRLASALGLPELRVAGLAWEGGHAGAALSIAASAVHAGLANHVVVFRSLAQGQFGRFGQFGGYTGTTGPVDEVTFPNSFLAPYGVMVPGQIRAAMQAQRFMHEHDIGQEALRAIALACYHHAQLNPAAVMHGRPLRAEDYDDSRWIAEPLRLFDFCMENDCAAALIVTTRERAVDLRQRPAFLRAVAHGSDPRQSTAAMNSQNFATANFTSVGRRLFEMAELRPADIDVAQLYDNFTIGVLMSIAELGFCPPEDLNRFARVENLVAPGGGLPINTAGGNLAEAYVHGVQLAIEAVRQLRGTSTAQVPDARHALVTSATLGPVTGAFILSDA